MDKKDIARRYLLNDKFEIEFFKVLDKIEIFIKKNVFKYTDFLDPYLAFLCSEVLKTKFDYVNFDITGGYKEAERKILILYPDYCDEACFNTPLKVIKIDNIPQGSKLNHRDVLGAILGLGLKREKLGDIIINDNDIQIITFQEIASFIESNIYQIGRYRVSAYIDDIDNVIPRKNSFITITGTVKSLRLDSISSVGFKVSRTKAMSDIKREKLKVNFLPVLTPSYNLKEGDLISYRGNGRIILDKVLGKTKKDRYKVSIKKFI
ncbi:YlmH family RNA-binding protein [Paramaledivibacter caminithermalis]|uniref:RNA-binding protein YlmH, contains S4-like domain n=1 Tax=Paramaledivibacter caminithermalis (strain DSM 15212 / CIP 107654 / DViRD3) TaxID=1121301 RepID=A0A1M6S3A7_PARC5|nr:YlmH/Sll1252 family protein [Paramaledivibacter caminithermalis]SHK39160.1 RNA-binding protein YlmH, contains S4-like domain [Paramaledivibacter caminithermalis DSM 15212]